MRRILGILEQQPGQQLIHPKLLRNSHLKGKDFDDAIKTLMEREQVGILIPEETHIVTEFNPNGEGEQVTSIPPKMQRIYALKISKGDQKSLLFSTIPERPPPKETTDVSSTLNNLAEQQAAYQAKQLADQPAEPEEETE